MKNIDNLRKNREVCTCRDYRLHRLETSTNNIELYNALGWYCSSLFIHFVYPLCLYIFYALIFYLFIFYLYYTYLHYVYLQFPQRSFRKFTYTYSFKILYNCNSSFVEVLFPELMFLISYLLSFTIAKGEKSAFLLFVYLSVFMFNFNSMQSIHFG